MESATSFVQGLKLAVVAASGLSKDALHIYAGLAVQLLIATSTRYRLTSILPWCVVLALAGLGELVDRHDDLTSLGHWRWQASLHDIVNTLFWPTLLLVLARFGLLGCGGSGPSTRG